MGTVTRRGIAPSALALAAFAALLLVSVGCGGNEQRPDYVARVDDQYLTAAELDEALQTMPPRLDTADARKQVIEQWITNALLFEEATRRGLRSSEEVRRQLEESERSVMASALLSLMYEEEQAEPTPAEIQSYFERNKELFRIREPFVRVRHLAHADRDTAVAARQELIALARSTNPDSLWQLTAARFSDDVSGSLDLSATHLPQSHLFSNQPELHGAMVDLRPGETSAVIPFADAYHVVQVVDRAQPGSLPEIEWVEDELRRRLVIQSRKQIYASQVQRLRNEALAREDLEIR